MTSSQVWLDELRLEVNSCNRCDVLGALTDRKIFGEGPSDAPVMSIAEAPGADEYTRISPFRGRAGAFWEGMLASVGWHRSELYVCNVIKCRPQYNGKSNALSPNLIEVDYCKRFLERQIEIVRPRLILAFGKIAGLALGILAPKQRMGDKVGFDPNWDYTYVGEDELLQKAKVLFTYHPSNLQNRPEGRNKCNEVFDQLQQAKTYFEETRLPWE
jgi:DNA polymerase